MAKVFRIFVEKKRGNDIEAGQTLADLRDNVGLNALDDLRIINRYYAQGLTEEEFDLAVKQILSEPNLDNVYQFRKITGILQLNFCRGSMTKGQILPHSAFSF